MKLSEKITALIEAAKSARKNAYCPYSRYPVGAAVMTKSGRIFKGCNVENASYGLSLCAERVAIFNAIAGREKDLAAICVVGRQAKPCGACRQVMFEFSNKNTPLYIVDLGLAGGRQKVMRTPVARMLPFPFKLRHKNFNQLKER